MPEQLAAITGHSTRSCERWLAGHVDPDGPATLSLMLSPHGPTFIEAKVGELSLKQQTAFWEEMKRAARRHELRLRRAKIDAEERDLITDRLF
ncbi:MAG: hypothetical protein AB7F22_10425 [Reyranella sp.]|uniref:hypothetical protein n=1 Tax=Reyranella sp. TaxID=1929291 RepID=UPI003D09B75C